MNHQYTLEPYNGRESRFECPGCGRQRTFSRYISVETGEYLDASVGRCNREDKCGYHHTPREYFKDYDMHDSQPVYTRPKINFTIPPEPSCIGLDLVLKSLSHFDDNHLVTYLRSVFGMVTSQELINMYFLGTSSHWNGATIFWQVDIRNRVRTGKIMLYDPYTGKRIKEPFNHISWVHTLLNQPGFNMKQGLFGEHLITEAPHKPIAIVESEKTAIIASGFIPEYIWIATGGLQNLNSKTCHPLVGKKVILFPDLGSEEKWKERIAMIYGIENFAVSDALQKMATEEERKQGLDIADFLTRQNYFKVGYLEEEVLSVRNPAKNSPESRLKRRLVA